MNCLLRICKIFWICFCAGLATLLLFLPIVAAASFSSTGNAAFTISQVWAWIMLSATGVGTEIRGREKIRSGQSYVIISNHQSHFDILALVIRLGIQFRWIIKRELRSVPLFGFALDKSKNIFIDRADRDSAARSIREGIRRFPPGVSVLFFAEGTRSPDGAIQPFKKGGFTTAVESGFPILPVTVNGSRKILPKGSLVFTPGSIEVVVGDPIDTHGFTHDTIGELMAATRSRITADFDPCYPSENKA